MHGHGILTVDAACPGKEHERVRYGEYMVTPREPAGTPAILDAPMLPGPSSPPFIARAGACGFAAATLVFRYLTVGALENDHFVHLARAHQVLHGAWPVRDFVDPGMPLQYLASAAVAWVFGPTLLTDVLVNTGLLAASAALTFLLADRATGTPWIAAIVTTLEMAAMPRLYNAPKLFVLLTVIAFGWRYADRPSPGRVAALAGCTTFAFLVRHDYGLYAGLATALLIAMRRAADNERDMARDLVIYGIIVSLCLLPWLAYVEWAIGLRVYVTSALAFSRAEVERTGRYWSDPYGVALLSILLALPIATAVISRGTRRLQVTFVHVAFACALLLLIEAVFLRDVLAARLPDVAGPAAVVTACFLGLVLPAHRVRLVAVLAIAATLTATASLVSARSHASITPQNVMSRARLVTSRLTIWPWPAVMPTPDLVPVAMYLNRCTEPTDHVLAGWFAPELAVLAQRPFAGGQAAWVPGYYNGEEEQAWTVRQLERQSPPVVFLDESFAGSWPRVHHHLTSYPFRFARRMSLEERTVDMWIDETRAVKSTDTSVSMPCFAR